MSDPTKKYSVTLPENLAEDARTQSEGAGLSAYVTQAVRRQLQHDRLAELVEVLEAENGQVSDGRKSEVRDEMRRALEEQGVTPSKTNKHRSTGQEDAA